MPSAMLRLAPSSTLPHALPASKPLVSSRALISKTAKPLTASRTRPGTSKVNSRRALDVRADEEDEGPPACMIAPFHSALSQLLDHRICRMGGEVEDGMANSLVAQLLYLDAVDPDEDVIMYVNSPGGSVTAGVAIFDTMRHIRPDVSTICVGMAASMGAFILASGKKGKRFALPNARVMIHQPLGGARGELKDAMIQSDEMQYHKKKMSKYLAEFTGKTYEEIWKDTDRDFFLSPDECVEYGILDGVLDNPSWLEAKQIDPKMYDFVNYDWRALPTLDPLHQSNIKAPQGH